MPDDNDFIIDEDGILKELEADFQNILQSRKLGGKIVAMVVEGDADDSSNLFDKLKAAFWKWYNKHAEDIIISKKLLFFKITIKVKHLLKIFEVIFGKKPEA